MRLAIIESVIPPKSDGPVMHLHEMHDEGFIVKVSMIELFQCCEIDELSPSVERKDSISCSWRRAN